MIPRYKTCLAPTTDRSYLLHAYKDSEALTVRLLTAADAPANSFVSLTERLPNVMIAHRFEAFVPGEGFDRPGTVWRLDAGITFSLPLLHGLRPRESWVLGMDMQGGLVPPFERFSLSEGTKRSRGALLKMLNVRQVAMIGAAFGAESMDDCQIVLVGGKHGCWTNFPFTHVFETISGDEVTGTQAPDFYPKAAIKGPPTVAPGRLARFVLEFVDSATGEVVDNGKRAVPVRLEATSGYLVDRVVYPENGRATFRWKALGLSRGDRVKIKSNWGTWSGDHEVEVRVA